MLLKKHPTPCKTSKKENIIFSLCEVFGGLEPFFKKVPREKKTDSGESVFFIYALK